MVQVLQRLAVVAAEVLRRAGLRFDQDAATDERRLCHIECEVHGAAGKFLSDRMRTKWPMVSWPQKFVKRLCGWRGARTFLQNTSESLKLP